MKATLEFDSYEEELFNVCSKGKDLFLVVWKIHEYLRSNYDTGKDISCEEALDRLNSIMDEHAIRLDMMS